MNRTTKMAVVFLALAIAQMAVIPSGYTDDEHRTGRGEEKTRSGENGREEHSTSPSNLPTVPATSLPTVPTTPLADGTALYNQYCSGCHGTSKLGRSVTSIQNAIKSNKGGMGSLSFLTAAQISAISGGGKTITPTPIQTITPTPIQTITPTPIQTYTPTPVPTLGTSPPSTPAPAPAKTWALYNQYCAGCHGTSKQGRSAAAIQSAISSFSQMAPLQTLTAAQITAIAAGQ